jgi:hypothetical protein
VVQIRLLTGRLYEDDVFVQLPERLVDEKTDDVRGGLATTFSDPSRGKPRTRRRVAVPCGPHTRDTRSGEDTAVDSGCGNRVNGMLQVEYRRFQKRDDVPYLSDE